MSTEGVIDVSVMESFAKSIDVLLNTNFSGLNVMPLFAHKKR